MIHLRPPWGMLRSLDSSLWEKEILRWNAKDTGVLQVIGWNVTLLRCVATFHLPNEPLSPELDDHRLSLPILSGLAGLTAAYILTNDPDQRFEVTIYEKHALFGMDFSSFSIPTEDIDAEGKRTKGEARIDVPLRVVFRRYYSSLFKLFEHLNLTFAPADMTLSFSKLPPPTPGTPSPLPTTYFSESCLDVDFLGFRFPIPNPRAHLTVFQASQIAADWYRFRAYARLIYHADHLGTLKGQTLSEFLRTGGYSDVFIHGAFMPAVASTSTCSYETTMRMPADIIVDFMAKRLLNDRVVKVREGVKAVCERLTEKVEVMRFGCGVKSVQCVQGIERKKVAVEDDTGRSETFDYVIFATQADQARRMLSASPTFPLASATAVPAALLRTLGSFVYESTSAVTHTDPTFMPRDRRDWSAINVCVPAQGTTQADVPEGCYPDQPMTTCWMNALMPSLKGQPDVFQVREARL
ncbi:hypothetical protein BC938DRAFT_480189 [Jimgerdemannia flammicorona]|uniref:Amine oxidase domain-containing protein n=1 Tax=Jimgerdemannia flammicorona TaxID=994334 RepID=A0A433QJ73_9FUNG|nr:hypothetical protein BC938DRAFT_480189 [Jimgerdemannia flammicorona]